MAHKRFNFAKKTLIIRSLTSFMFLILSVAGYSQSVTDFSGNWTMDNARSDAGYKDYKVVCAIIQTPQTISVQQNFLMKDGSKAGGGPALVYPLDGTVTSKENEGGIDKQSAKWSADKKVLTTNMTRTINGNNYGSNTTYTLSQNGQVLTIVTTNIVEDGTKIIEVYNRDK